MRAWIFDVDGTLANTDHRKHFLEKRPKDWGGWHSLAHLDEPHADIRELVWAGAEKFKYKIILCSGRSEDQRKLTENWMRRHDIRFDRLYMRRAGDRRDDSIIKLELLELMRADGFDPVLAFDDRDRVVAAWRSVGIRCLQVAPGSF
jgi:phosphoglycolate phosphatase-like HAD superfamily hydrolase